MYRKDIITRMGAVEQEWRVASLAVSGLSRRALDNPSLLAAAAVAHADVRLCLTNLEPTYLVRMFAVFEEAMREIWRKVYRRTTRPETYTLIQRCAARQHIPSSEIEDAHTVRTYRNAIVHGGDVSPIPLPTARGALCRFFSRMPPQW